QVPVHVIKSLRPIEALRYRIFEMIDRVVEKRNSQHWWESRAVKAAHIREIESTIGQMCKLFRPISIEKFIKIGAEKSETFTLHELKKLNLQIEKSAAQELFIDKFEGYLKAHKALLAKKIPLGKERSNIAEECLNAQSKLARLASSLGRYKEAKE